jgi:hypothetical protein
MAAGNVVPGRPPSRASRIVAPPLPQDWMFGRKRMVSRQAAFAGKSNRRTAAPTGLDVWQEENGQPPGRLRRQVESSHRRSHRIGCLAGREWSAARPPSRASRIVAPPLPQEWMFGRKRMVGCQAAIAGKPCSYRSKAAYTHPLFHHSTGRALARLQLLILIHPPLREAEWRCSSGGRRAAPFDEVEHIERRLKRSQPEAMPPDECRNEGTPSLSEGPDAGARPFGSFWGVCQKGLAVRAKP